MVGNIRWPSCAFRFAAQFHLEGLVWKSPPSGDGEAHDLQKGRSSRVGPARFHRFGPTPAKCDSLVWNNTLPRAASEPLRWNFGETVPKSFTSPAVTTFKFSV